MINNIKSKVLLITILVILITGGLATNANAAFLTNRLVSSNITSNIRAKFMESVSSALTTVRTVVKKVVEGFDIKVEPADNGAGLKLNFDYAGNYMTVESDNNGVVEFDLSSMTLAVKGNGATTIHIKIGERDIPINVVVDDGNVKLQGAITGVSFNGDIKANFDISEKQIAAVNATTEAGTQLSASGINAAVANKQDVTVLEKFDVNLAEIVGGAADATGVAGTVGGAAGLNGTEIAAGEAGLAYQFGAADPTGSVSGSILGNQLLSIQNKTLPIFTGIRLILSKIIK